MNWLLVVVLVILLGSALFGSKVGFIKTVFSLFSMILALILSMLLSPIVTDMLNNNQKFHDKIVNQVEKVLPMEKAEKETNEEFIKGLHLPKSVKDALSKNNNEKVYKTLKITNFNDYVTNYFAEMVIKAIAYIITFAVIFILLWVLCAVLNILSKLPVINSINKLAGLAVGLIQGLIIVWILFVLITVFGGTDLGQKSLKMIEESKVLSFIYDKNLLLGFATGATKLFASTKATGLK